MSPTTSSLRRALAATVAASIAVGGLAALAPAAQAAVAPSCTYTLEPASLRPGETTTFTVVTADGSSYPAIQVVDGHVVPGGTAYYGGNGGAPMLRSYEWWQSFNGGADFSAGYRVYAPNTIMEEVTDDTPFLCGGEVTLLPPATPQTIVFPGIADTPLATGHVTLAASADSGLPVTYRSDTPEVCTVADAEVTLQAQGICRIAASQPGNEEYAATPEVTQTFGVQLPQTITFPAIADQLLATGTISLAATSNSNRYIEYVTVDPSICSVPQLNGAPYGGGRGTARSSRQTTELQLNAVGTCTVTAKQRAGSTWIAATDVTRSFQITVPAPDPVLTLTVPAGAPLSDGTVTVRATSTTTHPAVTVTSATPTVCTVSAGSKVKLHRAGTCTVTARRAAKKVSKSFAVWGAPAVPAKGKATQVLSVLGQGETLTVTASPARVCRVTDGSVMLVAPGVCRIEVLDGKTIVRQRAVKVAFPKADEPPRQLTHGGTAYFAFDSAELSAKAKKALRSHLPTLKRAKVVVVYGNTYGPGKNSAHSRALAADRAAVVVAFLKDHGVKAAAVKVAAAMENPVSKNPAKNRRADIYYRA